MGGEGFIEEGFYGGVGGEDFGLLAGLGGAIDVVRELFDWPCFEVEGDEVAETGDE